MVNRGVVEAVVLCVVVTCPMTVWAQLPPEVEPFMGQWWLGFGESDIAGDPSSVVPYLFHADLAIGTDGITFERYDPGDYAPPTDITFQSITPDSQGWMNLTVRSEVDWGGGPPTVELITLPVAVTTSLVHTVYRQPDPYEHLGMMTMVPKAESLSIGSAIGTYMMCTHGFEIWDGSAATAKCGTLTLHDDQTYTGELEVSDGAVESPSGTWATDAAAREIILDGSWHIGAGKAGIWIDFDYDWSDDVLDYSYFLKLGSGRVVSEAGGYWLVQGFYSNTARLARTEWGTGLIDAEGNVEMALDNVDGESSVLAGTLTMEDNGALTFAETTGLELMGAISEDGNVIILGNLGLNDDLGMTVLIRPIEMRSRSPRHASGRSPR
jgi:hypothetical protein